MITECDLDTRLARFLFSYRTTPHTTTGVSPAELLMNRKLRCLPVWKTKCWKNNIHRNATMICILVNADYVSETVLW